MRAAVRSQLQRTNHILPRQSVPADGPFMWASGGRPARMYDRSQVVEVSTMFKIADMGPLDVGDYSPGVCNIGPAEIGRRRMEATWGWR